jgi:hypothetical protein
MFCHVLCLNNRYNTTRAVVIGSFPSNQKVSNIFKLRRTSGKAQDDEEKRALSLFSQAGCILVDQ